MKKVLSVILTVFMVLTVFGSLAEDAAVGNWYLIEFIYNGQRMSAEDAGESMKMEIRADSTYTITSVNDEPNTGKWTYDNGKYIVDYQVFVFNDAK